MQNSNGNLTDFSSPCVDNSAFLEENKEILKESANSEIKFEENSENNRENAPKSEENSINEGTLSMASSLEEQIQRDFKDFEVIYPNISKNSLLNDKLLRIFAEGKENKPLSVIYAQYMSFVADIASNAIKQEQTRQINAISSVGGLSSTKSSDDGYFTREQVLKMSQEEIKRNYKRIRESQARW